MANTETSTLSSLSKLALREGNAYVEMVDTGTLNAVKDIR